MYTMCWSPEVSIRTFVFTCVTLVFIYVTNTFTAYKTPLFNHPFAYVFMFAVACVQLVEYFLWKNLNHFERNTFFSKIAAYLIIAQHLSLMMMIPNPTIRSRMLLLYAVYLFVYYFYKKRYNPVKFHTRVGENGHLSWEWMNYKGYEYIWLIIGLLFYIVPALFIRNVTLIALLIPMLLTSLFFYIKYDTFGSMWCWWSNLLLVYFIINIVFIQPYGIFQKIETIFYKKI